MSQSLSDRLAAWAAPVLVGIVLSPLLIGYEPVGGDPDRIFRPIKLELARALKSGTLPFWSDKLGFGVPLLAESHAAALYPPNHILYRLFDVSTAYRLSMWLHNVLIAAATCAYARFLGITPWGAALAGVSFALCGFQAIHSSHEWDYHTLAFLPIVLLTAEKYLATGRLLWLASLALASGGAWTLGHFQIQTWTCLILAVITLWRILIDRRPFIRSAGVMVALMWGVLIAAAQLGPSWELARFVGQEDRDRIYYSFPFEHWIEPFFPSIYRDLDPEGLHWNALKTSGYEACLYVGSIPLILAFVGLFSRNRGTQVWKLLIALTLALATMPRWWPQGYEWFLMTPGIGLFRCPARWTVFASLGLALLAGAGMEHLMRRWRFWLGLVLALGAATTAIIATSSYISSGSDDPAARVRAFQIGTAAIGASFLITVAGRFWHRILPAFLILTACELSYLYFHMTTQWGNSATLPSASPVLEKLAKEPLVGLVGGPIDNLPLWAGRATAAPYVGFRLFPPNTTLSFLADPNQWPRIPLTEPGRLRSLGVTHIVARIEEAALFSDTFDKIREGTIVLKGWRAIWVGEDPELTRVSRPIQLSGWEAYGVRIPATSGANETWVLLRHELPEPGPYLATRTIVVTLDREASNIADNLLKSANQPAILSGVSFDRGAAINAHPATTATLDSWNGQRAEVTHDGGCVLVLKSANYPGWRYRINEGAWQPCVSANGGFQAALLEGRGPSRVEFNYSVTGWPIVATASAISTALAIALALWSFRRSKPVASAPLECGGSTPLSPG